MTNIDPAAVLAALGEGWEPYTPDGLTIRSMRGTALRLAFGQVRYRVNGQVREALFVDSCTPEEIAELALECDARADDRTVPTHDATAYVVQYGSDGTGDWVWEDAFVTGDEDSGRQCLAWIEQVHPETTYRLVRRATTETVIA